MSSVIVLLSGGIDSTTLAAKAMRDGRLHSCVFIDWFQPSVSEELQAALSWCNRNSVTLHERTVHLDTKHMSIGAGQEGARVVPHRNAAFLCVAANIASSEGVSELWYGATKGDYEDYYDCREEWAHKLSRALPGVSIRAPFAHHSKSEIVDVAQSLGVPVDLTWSCYEPSEPMHQCGECSACAERRESLMVSCGIEA